MLFPMVIILTVIEEGYCNFGPRGSAIHMKVGWGQVIMFLDKNYFGKLFLFQSLRGELSSVLQTELYAGSFHHTPEHSSLPIDYHPNP